MAPEAQFKAGVISMDLIVRDKKGKPVTDLRPEDLAITDGGSPVKITDLRLVSGSSTPALVTLVFDRFESGADKAARNAANEIVKAAATDDVSFAVLKVDGRLRLLQNYASDRDNVKKAIAAATDGARQSYSAMNEAAEKAVTAAAQMAPAQASGDRIRSQTMLASLLDSQDLVIKRHVPPSLAGLLALARGERSLRGRKAVVYFSEGLNVDPNTTDTVLSIIGTANEDGVSIYTVDVARADYSAGNGLMASTAMANMSAAGHSSVAPSGGPVGDSGPRGEGMLIREQMGRIEINGEEAKQPPSVILADATGGFSAAASGNMRRAAQRLMEDLSSYYVVSYAAPIPQPDDHFRAVVIKPVRAGLKVQAGAGYSAR